VAARHPGAPSFNTAEWRDFDDHAEREEQIGAGLAGALAEPGF
jgi:hypothetical protein